MVFPWYSWRQLPNVPGRKSDTLKEPVFFHSGPYALDEELVDGHAVGAINDMTPGLLDLKSYYMAHNCL